MRIGIDASRACVQQRTGIEEYSYQVIKHLRPHLKDCDVRLYVRAREKDSIECDLGVLPEQWSFRRLWASRLWTTVRLSWELYRNPVDVLFVSAHVVPPIHPSKTIVVVHGLEYEVCPSAYSLVERLTMRLAIQLSCRWAWKIIAVSENTKHDLMRLYHIPEEKIVVIYEGQGFRSAGEREEYQQYNGPLLPHREFLQTLFHSTVIPEYFFFVGRLEERKNITGMIQAFESYCRKNPESAAQLVLAGKPGYGYEAIRNAITDSPYAKRIVETGYVNDQEKEYLFRTATVFLFPTLYEGFGLPILEAQSFGVPVVTSNNSSMPEVAGESALLVNPAHSDEIAFAMETLMRDKLLRTDIIERGFRNLERFSWQKAASEISSIIR